MSDDIIESGFLGKSGVGAEAIHREVRILSTAEIHALIEAFVRRSGLRRSQFAVNGWGFPFIPIPDVQSRYAHLRTVPKGTTKAFFGHPVYWIDPELTARRPEEGEQEWCIRMFYLIDAMGYWTEDIEFIDFLKVNGFSFEDAQIEAYHRIADDSATDDYEFLGVDDLELPLADAEASYEEILRRCFAIQKSESIAMLQSQAREYVFARKALGANVHSWSASYDDQDGVWDKRFLPVLEEVARKYNERAASGDQIVSDLRKESLAIFDRLQEVIVRLNKATSILELPVKATVTGAGGPASRISFIATAMSVANQRDNLRKVMLADIEKAMADAFGSGNSGEGGFDGVVEAMSKVYSTAWNRLRLAFVNFDNLRDGTEIHSSVVEMVSALQADTVSTGGGLAAALSEDFRK